MESKQSRKPGRRITLVCGFHYVKLVYRALLLFAAVLLYVITRVKGMTLPTYFPILLRWELTLRLRPERFAENTNACLSCKNCDEKLCLHKRHILRLAKQIKATVKETVKEKLKK